MAEIATTSEGGNNLPVDALPACVSDETARIEVRAVAEAGLYSDAGGRRYFATDLSFWNAKGLTGQQRQMHLVAVPVGEPNRWGLIPAWIIQLGDQNPRLYQAEQLSKGNAVFAPDKASPECAVSLRRAEAAARRAESGEWGTEGDVRIFSGAAPASFQGNAGRYVIARGRIVSLGKTRSTRYLNFGRHWKSDLTVTLKSSEEAAFNEGMGADGWQIEDLQGLFVEVRGVLQEKDGPLIALRHPEQLRVLERKRAGSGGQNSN
ncbi:hypothetical protein ABVF61_27635 [Roseibium sp. HPY-6]|uniref:hypothetical protein n=1 Tax=Roseibium sp. HPY-6 TaxID=3229852 RepID=UPI00338E2FC2